jgi:hypothetical protein
MNTSSRSSSFLDENRIPEAVSNGCPAKLPWKKPEVHKLSVQRDTAGGVAAIAESQLGIGPTS